MRNAAYYHTRRRLRQRYGVSLKRTNYARLCREIARLLPCLNVIPIHSRRVIVMFPLRGQMVRWVFCTVDRLIITALPEFDWARL